MIMVYYFHNHYKFKTLSLSLTSFIMLQGWKNRKCLGAYLQQLRGNFYFVYHEHVASDSN